MTGLEHLRDTMGLVFLLQRFGQLLLFLTSPVTIILFVTSELRSCLLHLSFDLSLVLSPPTFVGGLPCPHEEAARK